MDNNWHIPSYKTTVFKPQKHRYCVCIPVLNEGEKFKRQILQMKKFVDIADIIVADGGSNDGSTDLQFLKRNNISSLLIKTGKGHLSAQLRMAFHYALQHRYKGIITVDGNGKDNIKAIPKFIALLDKGYDFIQGSRFMKGGKAIRTPLMRFLAIRLLHAPLISMASGFHYTDTTNGFRAYSRPFLLDPRVQPFRKIFDKYELLFYLSIEASKRGYRVVETPVIRSYPVHDTPTKITLLKGNLDILITLFKTVFGLYRVKKVRLL